jgi:hypothetical protein
MDDLIKTMKAQLYDRASSPLIFSFVCSWIFWNYRLVVILFSGAKSSEKFVEIEALPSRFENLTILGQSISPDYYWLWMGFLGPMLVTILYLVVLPYAEEKAFELSSRKAVRMKKIKLEAENDTPIGEEERMKLRETIRAAEKIRDEGIESQRKLRGAEVDDLRTQLDRSRTTSTTIEKNLNEKIDSMRLEIDQLKRDKSEVENRVVSDSEIIARIFFLDEGARKMFDAIARASDTPTEQLTEVDEQGKKWLKQLLVADLVEVFDGKAQLTGFGLQLTFQRTLRHPDRHQDNVTEV